MPVPAVITPVLSATREGVTVPPPLAPDTADRCKGSVVIERDCGGAEETLLSPMAVSRLSLSLLERGETTSSKPGLVHPPAWEDRVAS